MHTLSTNLQVASGRKIEACSNVCVCGCGYWCGEAGWDLGGGRLRHNGLVSVVVWFSSVDMLYLCCIAGWEEDAYDIRRVHDSFPQR